MKKRTMKIALMAVIGLLLLLSAGCGSEKEAAPPEPAPAPQAEEETLTPAEESALMQEFELQSEEEITEENAEEELAKLEQEIAADDN
jgi:hypothetical protein